MAWTQADRNQEATTGGINKRKRLRGTTESRRLYGNRIAKPRSPPRQGPASAPLCDPGTGSLRHVRRAAGRRGGHIRARSDICRRRRKTARRMGWAGRCQTPGRSQVLQAEEVRGGIDKLTALRVKRVTARQAIGSIRHPLRLHAGTYRDSTVPASQPLRPSKQARDAVPAYFHGFPP
jgi:hypothetical protein